MEIVDDIAVALGILLYIAVAIILLYEIFNAEDDDGIR